MHRPTRRFDEADLTLRLRLRLAFVGRWRGTPLRTTRRRRGRSAYFRRSDRERRQLLRAALRR
jgi:hypothetical protein